jgi:hypothetical protein
MDEQVELLRGIWNEMKALNGRIDKTNSGLDALRTDLKAEIAGVRVELKGEFEVTRTELRGELAAVRTELKSELAATRTELRSELEAVRKDLGGELAVTRTELREEISKVRGRTLERDRHLAGAIRELSLDVRVLTGAVHSWRDEHRLDREEIRARVARLESHVGIGPEPR